MRLPRGRRRGLGLHLGIMGRLCLLRPALLDRAMMPDNATGRGAEHRVMPRHMAGDAAHHRARGAAGKRGPGDSDADRESGGREKSGAEYGFHGVTSLWLAGLTHDVAVGSFATADF
jgi:hypothetical protein